MNEAPFPQPKRRDGEEPCGECRIQPGETCDVCGAKGQSDDDLSLDSKGAVVHSYEYAGFKYTITETRNGIRIWPVEGQHPAANKDRHRRAAVECWRSDHGK